MTYNRDHHTTLSELGRDEAIETVIAMVIFRLDELNPAESGSPNLAMNLELLIRDQDAAADALSSRVPSFNRGEIKSVSDGFLGCLYHINQQVSALPQ